MTGLSRCTPIGRFALLAFFLPILAGKALGQPAPFEVMMGHQAAWSKLIVNKPLSEGSRFGFVHLGKLTYDYQENQTDIVSLNVLSYELFAGGRIVGGNLYISGSGLRGTTGLLLLGGSPRLFRLMMVRVVVEQDPALSALTMLQYKPKLTEHLNGYAYAESTTIATASGHEFSFQEIRLGLALGNSQFGLALDLSESSPGPTVEANFGVFVRQEIH